MAEGSASQPFGRRLDDHIAAASARLNEANQAREVALAACRQAIRGAGRAIRAIHRHEGDGAHAWTVQSEQALREAQRAVAPYPAVAHAGFLHDAEKEYAEAVFTRVLVDGGELPGPDEMNVGVPAWLNGMAEAASEMRRHMLDLLRAGKHERAEAVLQTVDDVYDRLMSVDFPDAITGGLRRTTDALRAVLERSRSDLTTTVLQTRLQRAVESRLPEP